MIREFNEETGFLMSDIIKVLSKKQFLKKKFYFDKSKYMLGLLEVSDTFEWNILPDIYSKIFDGVEQFNHRDSEELMWVDLFDFKEDNSYLLTMVINKINASSHCACCFKAFSIFGTIAPVVLRPSRFSEQLRQQF